MRMKIDRDGPGGGYSRRACRGVRLKRKRAGSREGESLAGTAGSTGGVEKCKDAGVGTLCP